MMSLNAMRHEALRLEKLWKTAARWTGIKRPYSGMDVVRLRGSYHVANTLGALGAEKFWKLLHKEPYIPALGCLTGNQAVQQAEAGLKAIYLSGWQVAGDANDSLTMYPDQSLYSVTSVPTVVQRINNALLRADQIQCSNGVEKKLDYLIPIVADAEAGFGGALNAFELTKNLIRSGAAAIHLEDQLSSAKKCGHLGGKVLVPISEHITKLIACRLAADIMGTPTVIIGRTDAMTGTLLTTDCDERDKPFIKKGAPPTGEGFYHYESGVDASISRSIEYAPYADVLWCETGTPDVGDARRFAEGVHKAFPGKLLAYNCSPSFNWKLNLSDRSIKTFQKDLAAMGYRFQFVTLAGFHSVNYSMFNLARGYAHEGMAAYSRLQQKEFESEKFGYKSARHQEFVGTGYFDDIAKVVSSGTASTIAMEGSTEASQFAKSAAKKPKGRKK